MIFINRLAALAVSLSVLLSLVNASHVIEATDKSIDSILKPGLPTMLDVYASWCSHCKKLAPVYDELSDLFAFAKDKVQFVKIDGDIHRKTSKKFNVEYYPTLKFIKADGSEIEVPSRDLQGMADFVYEQTGISPKKAQAPPSSVRSLDDDNFDAATKGKDVLVSFTASWCGHCKNMKPEYEKLSQIYARDGNSIVIANIDCTEGQPTTGLASKYGVSGYPTVLLFPKDGSGPIPYQSGRTVDAFVRFLNEKGVGFRNVDGSLLSSAGTIDELNVLAEKVASSYGDESNLNSAVSELKEVSTSSVVNSSTDSIYAKLYIKYAEKFVSSGGPAYVEKETTRLSKLIGSNTLAAAKVDELQRKINILKTFAIKPEDEVVHEDL